jgi:uncharacterized delta-60 repeat protein
MWFLSRNLSRPALTPLSYRPQLERLEDRCLLSAGQLDTTFGSGGIATTAIGTSADAYAVALQSDGKIVVGGTSSTTSGRSTIDHFTAARYMTSGSLDTTFGSGGEVVTSWGKKGATSADAYAMALQSDGKIVLTGVASSQFALARYNTSGTLDTTFGSGGILTTLINAYTSKGAEAVAIQSDGKIVVAGTSSPTTGYIEPHYITLARYNSNGTLDTTFGSGGSVISQLGSGDSEARAVVLQSDGKIVVGGWIILNNQLQFTAASYNTNGTLDTTFGAGTGYAAFSTNTGSNAYGAYSVVMRPDGKIVAAGMQLTTTQTWTLARFNTDGTLDSTFNGTGIVPTTVAGYADALALQSDGKIVVEGSMLNPTYPQFELGRFNTDGSLDATFNGTGLVNTVIGSSSLARGVLIQTDGKIVAAGSSPYNTSADSFALARYLGDASASAVGVTTAAAASRTDIAAASFIMAGDPPTLVARPRQPTNIIADATAIMASLETMPGPTAPAGHMTSAVDWLFAQVGHDSPNDGSDDIWVPQLLL